MAMSSALFWKSCDFRCDTTSNDAALPEAEAKVSRRKSKTPERGRSAADEEEEDAYQSAKCYFDLKVCSLC